MRVGPSGVEIPVVQASDGTHYDLRPLTAQIDGAFLAADGIDRAQDAVESAALPEIDIDGLRLGAPIARPSAIVCIGMNYAAHARESGAEPPTVPVVFYKAPNTLVGPDDDVLLPPGATKLDWEVELAVVIGRRCRYLESPDDALTFVAGYAVSNDVSERAYQLEQSGGQWSKGKSCETFNPMGPWLVTGDELIDPARLRLRSYVNGEPRQDSSTSDMIFDIGHIIHHLSQYMVLEPGDVINSGTPEGVALSGRFPYLAPGDLVELEIESLGRQRQTIRAQGTSSRAN
jgi:2-keto-4-pentenoate hydratase/2-oxohepta-3-ene-1,7-dioic acid hydratase (catechol pathway)